MSLSPFDQAIFVQQLYAPAPCGGPKLLSFWRPASGGYLVLLYYEPRRWHLTRTANEQHTDDSVQVRSSSSHKRHLVQSMLGPGARHIFSVATVRHRSGRT